MTLMKQSYFVIAGFFVFSAGLYALVLQFYESGAPALQAQPLDAYAQKVLAECGVASSRQRCYDDAIPKLMDEISLEDAFGVVKRVQAQDDGYWFCHAVGHNISAREYRKNPHNWRDIVTRCEIGICSNGCLHGALQEHFSSSALTDVQLQTVMPDLLTICEKRKNWQPTMLQQSSCYHELGHLSLYLANADVTRAGGVCDAVTAQNKRQQYFGTCIEGIFMQIFEPREPDDFGLIYSLVPHREKLTQCEQYTLGTEKGGCWKVGWRPGVEEFCNQFSKMLRYACFREAWVIDDHQIETSEGIERYCTYAEEDTEKQSCYNKLIYALMSKFEFDVGRVKPVCEHASLQQKGLCFASIATRLIETDKRLVAEAVGICRDASRFGVEEKCYGNLASYAKVVFHPGSVEAFDLCTALPDSWRDRCNQNNK